MDEGDERPRRTWRPERPPVVRDWRWVVGIIGRSLIVLGLMIIAFVAYQLWGTGIEFRANQRDLASDFKKTQASILAEAASTTLAPTTTAVPTTTPPTTSPSGTAPATTATATTPPPTTAPPPTLPPIGLGDVVGALKMPSITSKTYYLVAGVRVEDLKRGVGHYPSTPLPGEYGNAALAGHRTTYGAPFEDLDKLEPGDRLVIDTLNGAHYEYVVDGSEIIKPSDVRVLGQPSDPTEATLTLTTCHPKRSTKQRLVIYSRLDPAASSAPGARTANYQTVEPPTTTITPTTTTSPPTTAAGATTVPSTSPRTTVAPTTAAPEPSSTVSDSSRDGLAGEDGVDERDAGDLARGWFHDHGAWWHILGWGALLVLISLGAWRVGLYFGHTWVAYLTGFAPFVFVLYFFFQNVNRLLPPGL